ncbi:hypothetical protein HID58_053244 [Brassica napus]|uniref:Uncharacterized protein n=1 Tax=Brassica napus TaxID=3708 RepID=A0ABQ8AFN2_BRANA|nr:hypothetical protein HID58_053244 [Brassica napus]
MGHQKEKRYAKVLRNTGIISSPLFHEIIYFGIILRSFMQEDLCDEAQNEKDLDELCKNEKHHTQLKEETLSHREGCQKTRRKQKWSKSRRFKFKINPEEQFGSCLTWLRTTSKKGKAEIIQRDSTESKPEKLQRTSKHRMLERVWDPILVPGSPKRISHFFLNAPIIEEDTTNYKRARGVNNGVNQSSLDYLFGSGESPSAVAATMGTTTTTTTTTTTDGTGGRPVTTTTTTVTENKKIPAGVRGSPNNYFRSEGQNCGNFLTERPSTKVHAAPGGGSSLGYLFGGPSSSAESAKK